MIDILICIQIIIMNEMLSTLLSKKEREIFTY